MTAPCMALISVCQKPADTRASSSLSDGMDALLGLTGRLKGIGLLKPKRSAQRLSLLLLRYLRVSLAITGLTDLATA